jgi:hypothetical protein
MLRIEEWSEDLTTLTRAYLLQLHRELTIPRRTQQHTELHQHKANDEQ